jgi:hypothetical protein
MFDASRQNHAPAGRVTRSRPALAAVRAAIVTAIAVLVVGPGAVTTIVRAQQIDPRADSAPQPTSPSLPWPPAILDSLTVPDLPCATAEEKKELQLQAETYQINVELMRKNLRVVAQLTAKRADLMRELSRVQGELDRLNSPTGKKLQEEGYLIGSSAAAAEAITNLTNEIHDLDDAIRRRDDITALQTSFLKSSELAFNHLLQRIRARSCPPQEAQPSTPPGPGPQNPPVVGGGDRPPAPNPPTGGGTSLAGGAPGGPSANVPGGGGFSTGWLYRPFNTPFINPPPFSGQIPIPSILPPNFSLPVPAPDPPPGAPEPQTRGSPTSGPPRYSIPLQLIPGDDPKIPPLQLDDPDTNRGGAPQTPPVTPSGPREERRRALLEGIREGGIAPAGGTSALPPPSTKALLLDQAKAATSASVGGGSVGSTEPRTRAGLLESAKNDAKSQALQSKGGQNLGGHHAGAPSTAFTGSRVHSFSPQHAGAATNGAHMTQFASPTMHSTSAFHPISPPAARSFAPVSAGGMHGSAMHKH